MFGARKIACKVISKQWLTPSVFTLGFEPSSKFSFLPGQFLSLIIEREQAPRARRIYSFSSGKKGEYELCVQVVEGGLGSNYLASLNVGDSFFASAPYGDFVLETEPSQNVCFIATGTGIAPFKAMVTSKQFLEEPPQGAMLLFGARTQQDILFPGLFESQGLSVVHALSQPGSAWKGFSGRVTDYLRTLSEEFPWSSTVFYICGNGAMVKEVERYLRQARQVPSHQIRFEIYFVAAQQPQTLKKAA